MRLTVKVHPASRRSEIGSLSTDLFGHRVLQVYVRSIPEKGAANAEVIEVLAAFFQCPKSSIAVLSGGKSRLKSIVIDPADTHMEDRLKALEQ